MKISCQPMPSALRLYFTLIVAFTLLAFPALSADRRSTASEGDFRLKFRKLSLTDGLSQSTVRTIYQDSIGYLWLGTFAGLNRYDGNEFLVYKTEPGNPNSLPGDNIFGVVEDKDGHLWVATSGGLSRMENRNTGRTVFHNYFTDKENPRSLADNFIFNIFRDHRDTLWVVTAQSLHRYVPETDDFDRIGYQPNQPISLTNWNIQALSEDRDGNLLVGTSRGLTAINAERTESIHLLKLTEEEAARYTPEALRSINDLLKNQPIASISDKTDSTTLQTFTLHQKTSVLIVSLGEFHRDQWFDFGSIQRGEQTVWTQKDSDSRYAGGAPRNRLAAVVLDLEPGAYDITYTADENHHPGNWQTLPPVQRDLWGIRALSLSPEQAQNLSGLLNDREVFNPLLESSVTLVEEDGQGRMWIGSRQSGLIRLDKPIQAMSQKAEPPRVERLSATEYPVSYVQDFLEDRHGNIWLASGQGLTRVDAATGEVRQQRKDILQAGGLETNEIISLLEDRQGALWIGTILHGLNVWTPWNKTFELIRQNSARDIDLNGNQIYGFAESPRNTIWVATRTGLSVFDRQNRVFLPLLTDSKAGELLRWAIINTVHALPNGLIAAGTHQGLVTFKPEPQITEGQITGYRAKWLKQHTFTINDEPQTPSISCLLGLKSGALWIGTQLFGVIRAQIDEKGHLTQIRQWPSGANLLGRNHISSLYEDRQNRIWMGTYGGGMARFDPAGDRFEAFIHKTEGKVNSAENAVMTMVDHEDWGFWVGTYGGGIRHFREPPQSSQRYTTAHGLPDNVIYGMQIDPAGAMWISTNHGLGQLRWEDGGLKVFHYTIADGLQSQEFNRGAFFQDAGGSMYFGGIAGFNYFNPSNFPVQTPPGNILLNGMEIFGEPVQLERPLFELGQMELAPGQNNLSFLFSALNLHGQSNFLYQLQGVDHQWQETSLRSSPIYSNLEPGRYTFEVKSRNRLDGSTSQTARINLYLKPYFYQTNGFIWLMVLIAGLIVFLVVKLTTRNLTMERERQRQFTRDLMRELERDRARIAAGLHDGLGQNLLVVNSALKIQAKQVSQPEAKELNELSDRIRESLDEVRNIAYDLRPHHLDKLGLQGAISTIAGRVEKASKLRVFLEWEPENFQLTKDREIHVYRIVQEAMNNIVRHADASVVRISFGPRGDVHVLEIADNGRGIDKQAKQAEGLGLRTMHERVHLLRGQLQIQTQRGKGTLLQITWPTAEEDS